MFSCISLWKSKDVKFVGSENTSAGITCYPEISFVISLNMTIAILEIILDA